MIRGGLLFLEAGLFAVFLAPVFVHICNAGNIAGMLVSGGLFLLTACWHTADLAASCRKNRMRHRSGSAAVRHCIRYDLFNSNAALSKPSAQAAKHRHCTGLQSKGHYAQPNAAPTFRSCGNLPIGTRNRFLYRFRWTRSR